MSHKQKQRTVVFLGAGASAADGAPVQSTLFGEHFCARAGRRHPLDRDLGEFFEEFFGIDVKSGARGRVVFPTFEEILGVLELADAQGESFRGWGTPPPSARRRRPRIQQLRDALILLIADVLDKKFRGAGRSQGTHHDRLLNGLEEELSVTSFVSLNYDILIDNALVRLYDRWDVDYCAEFANFDVSAAVGRRWARPRPSRSVRLLKLHGSLNWLYCTTCRALQLTPKEKGVCQLKWRPEDCVCARCSTLSVPIIIPPTYFKALSNFYLRGVWDAAERDLMKCERLIFCGYSFPDADVHVRYLLKRMELNREQPGPEVFVVNEHRGKRPAARKDEQQRYARFFRDKRRLHWTRLSFQAFAANPRVVDRRSSWARWSR